MYHHMAWLLYNGNMGALQTINGRCGVVAAAWPRSETPLMAAALAKMTSINGNMAENGHRVARQSRSAA